MQRTATPEHGDWQLSARSAQHTPPAGRPSHLFAENCLGRLGAARRSSPDVGGGGSSGPLRSTTSWRGWRKVRFAAGGPSRAPPFLRGAGGDVPPDAAPGTGQCGDA
eukprot:gene41543-49756_t